MIVRATPFLVCFFIGALLGLWLDGALDGALVAAYQPEDRSAPNNAVLETKPNAKPSLPAPKKPRGAKVTGTVELELRGKAPTISPEAEKKECLAAQDFSCPPIHVRLDVGDVDGQPYVSARSGDGTELVGQFLPRIAAQKMRRDSVGVFIGGGSTVVLYERRITDRLTVGGALASMPLGQTVPMIGAAFSF